MKLIFLLHLATTLWMTGVIWFVQIVHYALFDGVGAAGFGRYAARHGRLTTSVVAPLMLAEALTGLTLLFDRPPSFEWGQALFGFALIVVVWLSTVFIQVPQHGALARGFDRGTYKLLLVGNWLRTAAWTVRSLLLLYVTWDMI